MRLVPIGDGGKIACDFIEFTMMDGDMHVLMEGDPLWMETVLADPRF